MRILVSAVVRFFLTGMAALLPLVVTVFVLSWLVRLVDAYIGPSSAFGPFLVTIFGPERRYAGYVVGYLVVVVVAVLLGFLVTRATIARIRRAIDSTFASIPLFGHVYTAVGQVVSLLGQEQGARLGRFGGIVEVRIGGVSILALLTSEERYVLSDGREHFLVFIPSSPLPVTGLNILVPVEQVRRVDMPVEDLAKVMMSFGLLGPQVLKRPLSELALKSRQDGLGISR